MLDATATPVLTNATATYSPDDDKLRIQSPTRFGEEIALKIKMAGFRWAPKQKLWFALWSPSREDLLTELCGEIGDEDTSLVERAQERAERFEEYSEKRQEDAERAYATLTQIADHIPAGQPVIVGHHSQRRAERDKERLESGMRKAVKMWQTSTYWTARAEGAIASAKYRESREVRFRRIKKLEAEIRKMRASFTPKDSPPHIIKQHNKENELVDYVYVGQGRAGHWVEYSKLPAIERYYSRWIAHTENRIAYERAMLQEQGGTVTDKFSIEVGGMVQCGGHDGGWYTVTKINKQGGQVVSVTTNAKYQRVMGIEQVTDYRPPTEEQKTATKEATKLPPICNYRTGPILTVNRFYPSDTTKDIRCEPHEMTQADWNARPNDYKGTRTVRATETHGVHRVRVALVKSDYRVIFITDAKEKLPPAIETVPAQTKTIAELPKAPRPDRPRRKPEPVSAQEEKFTKLKDALRQGVAVQVVAADELFPTPPELAARMVEIADIRHNDRVLEPSAGTGNILRAIQKYCSGCALVACEINIKLATALHEGFPKAVVFNRDFLNGVVNGDFHRIVMNPPFSAEVEHVNRAWSLLADGGRLVAVMSAGITFRKDDKYDDLRELIAGHGWMEELPEDTFKQSGTSVRTVLVVLDK